MKNTYIFQNIIRIVPTKYHFSWKIKLSLKTTGYKIIKWNVFQILFSVDFIYYQIHNVFKQKKKLCFYVSVCVYLYLSYQPSQSTKPTLKVILLFDPPMVNNDFHMLFNRVKTQLHKCCICWKAFHRKQFDNFRIQFYFCIKEDKIFFKNLLRSTGSFTPFWRSFLLYIDMMYFYVLNNSNYLAHIAQMEVKVWVICRKLRAERTIVIVHHPFLYETKLC